jgi:serine/threonine-protein kinase
MPPTLTTTEAVADDEIIGLSAAETQSIAHPAARETEIIEAPARPVLPQPGDRIGPYVLQDLLGSGASCHVVRGWDEIQARPVAIKVVNWGNVFDREAALKQMRTEAACLARVKHPRVLQFLDFGFDARWPYLVTEFVEGRPLGELIRSGGALPIAWTLHLMNQVVEGLGAVWKAGIVHRDLKPDNILINAAGVAKLIDFGVARCDALKATDATGIELAGTAAYLSPEQAKNAAAADLRSDIYSLGVLFYETLTGKLPFEGKNRMQMIFQHINTQPVSPSKIDPSVPPLAGDLCLWMLAKNPAERPQGYADLREGLNTVIASLAK